jgi:excisionase family DNA binding protein
MSDRFLTLDELAERWQCSRAYIYAALKSGTLVGYNLGGWKFKAEEVERFEEAQKRTPVFRRKPGPKPKRRFITKGV